MSHITLVIVVVGKVSVHVRTVVPVVAVAGGDNTADGKSATDVGVWAMLESVSKGSAVGAAGVGVVSEREGPAERAVVPRP